MFSIRVFKDLRKLASSCQFRTLTEEMIRDRLLIGIQDTGTNARLLWEEDLSLDKALDMFKSSEIKNKQIRSLQHESKQSNEELHLVQDKSKTKKNRKPRPSNPKNTTKGPKKTWKCKFCGQGNWHSKPTDCRAYGQQCRICKINHFSKVCLSRKGICETVHLAEEAKVDYDSEESILKTEEISAIDGRGKQNNDIQ